MRSLEYSALKIRLACDSKALLVKTQLEIFLEKNQLKISNWKMKVFVEEYYIKTKAMCIIYPQRR
jgi:hypothetical protein